MTNDLGLRGKTSKEMAFHQVWEPVLFLRCRVYEEPD